MPNEHDTAPATPDESVSQEGISESERKLIAFEIAESAKKQVTTWAKWVVGTAVVVGATLGIKTYLDIQTSIRNATEKQIELAQKRSDNAIGKFEEEQRKELDAFREQSRDAIATLDQDIQKVLTTVQRTGHEAEVAILAAVVRTTTGTESARTVARKSRQRPIGPGISVSAKGGTAVTICCVVKNQANQRFILTPSYIVGMGADGGEIVIQPGASDGGTDTDAIGSVVRVTEIAALIRLNDGIDVYYDLPEIGKISGIAEPRFGEPVRKYGRTTGLTMGTVSKDFATYNVYFSANVIRPIECFVVTPVADRFSAEGDGGAPVVNNNDELLGMIFAGTSFQSSPSVVVPIKPILEELGVEVLFTE